MIAACFCLLLGAGHVRDLLEGVLLRGHLEMGLNVLEALLEGIPIIRKLELLHLPSLMYQPVSLKNVRVFVVKRHIY